MCRILIIHPYPSPSVTLPLRSLAADIQLVDVLARVQLTQVFYNDSPEEAGKSVDVDATYRFPVPAGAAVCAFEALLDNGTTIVGIVKEKDEAKKEYDQAIAAGKQAALAVHDRTDEFSISVGNLPPKSTITVRLTYVLELADDGEAEQVRFVLPTTIAPKYGEPMKHYTRIPGFEGPTMSISASVQMNQAVRAVASPSHTVQVSMGSTQEDANETFEPKHAHISLTADTLLDRDFIMTVKAGGLEAPRCTSETYQSSEYASAPAVFTSPQSIGSPPPTTALALTLAPRFAIPPLPSQEYILVADRSGSMGGFKIQALRSALQLVLRSLPPRGSYFQIVSFGSNHTSLFTYGSVPYNADSLAKATKHIDKMDADYGGTEIRSALEEGAFEPRRKDMPTSVFVLTDGETYDLAGVLAAVKNAVSSAKGGNTLRVFALGIGNGVDVAMVGGIAREGNGIAQFVSENERMEAKLVKMLVAAKGAAVRVTGIDWTKGVDGKPKSKAEDEEEFEIIDDGATLAPKAKLSLFDSTLKPETIPSAPAFPIPQLESFEDVQQGPQAFPILYPGSRAIVYAILSNNGAAESVTLHAVADSGEELELEIPVNISTSSLQSSQVPLIHTLAARKLLADLDDNNQDSTSLDIIRAKMVRLGLTYNLASKHTSFVAIEPEDAKSQRLRPKRAFAIDSVGAPPVVSPPPPSQAFTYARRSSSNTLSMGFKSSSLPYCSPAAPSSSSAPSMKQSAPAPAPQPKKSGARGGFGGAVRSLFGGGAPKIQAQQQPGRTGNYATASSSPALSDSIGSPTDDSDSELLDEPHSIERGDDQDASFYRHAPPPPAAGKSKRFAAPSSPPSTSNIQSADITQLIRLQAFDGSFADVKAVCQAAGVDHGVLPAIPHGLTRVWATIIALAIFENRFAGKKDEWSLVAEKARGFVVDALGEDGMASAEAEQAVKSAIQAVVAVL